MKKFLFLSLLIGMFVSARAEKVEEVYVPCKEFAESDSVYYGICIGSFVNEPFAEELAKVNREAGNNVYIQEHNGYYRVIIGFYTSIPYDLMRVYSEFGKNVFIVTFKKL